MKLSLAGLRLGVVLLFLIGVLSPVATTGAGAQDLTCDDFNSERAAQAVLDADPDMEETLDPDGDGVACNHEEDATEEATEEATDDATDDGTEEATEEAADGAADGGSGGDLDAYLADVTGQADAWAESFAALEDLDPISGGLEEGQVEELTAIIEEFTAAPDTAAEFEAPEGAEDVQAAFEDLADGYAEIADTFLVWLETDAGSTEEADAEDVYIEALDAIPDLQDAFDTAVEDAGGSTDGTDDGTDPGTDDGADGGDLDTYIADVTDQADAWAESLATLEDLDPLGGGLDEDQVDEVLTILEEFAAAPDTAAGFEAPEGAEDVQSAFEDLADGYAEIADAFGVWAETEAGSPEEADAEDVFDEAIAAVPDLQDAFDTAVEDTGGTGGTDDGTGDATDDGTDDATDDGTDGGTDSTDDATDDGTGGDADTEAYLEDVRTHADELIEGGDRLIEILSAEEVTDADRDDLAAILELWAAAPDEAAAIDVPDGMEDVQSAYEDLADAYATVGENFNAWLETEPESVESDEAWEVFTGSLVDATTLAEEFDAILTDAGA